MFIIAHSWIILPEDLWYCLRMVNKHIHCFKADALVCTIYFQDVPRSAPSIAHW